MFSALRSFSAKLDILSSGVRLRVGSGRDVRSWCHSCAVNASASVPDEASRASVIVTRSSRPWVSFLPDFKARIPYYWRTQGGLAMAWACPRCTFLNQGGGGVCGMCALPSPAPVVDSGPEWSCPSCTFLNHYVESSCEMCNTARPELSELERTNSADQGTRSTGKFRPLRAPQRRNADKERSHEAENASSSPAVSNDLHSFLKESDMISRKRKAAAVDDEEDLNANETDGFREKPAAAGDREVSNRLLGELHTQRMARINKSMASSDREKNIQQNHGQASSALAVDSSTQRKSDETTAGPCPNVVDAVETIVILTYNVWFREDLELEARMNAIGKIIQLHQPHVICFQIRSWIYALAVPEGAGDISAAEANSDHRLETNEAHTQVHNDGMQTATCYLEKALEEGSKEVTPNIYSIFQKSSWWRLYECSITPTQALKRAYFCLQLSRLSVSAFHRNPYNNSIMGRELAMADLDYAPGQQLVVATTHLESPCPAPPTWNQMFTRERVFQANEALKLMKDLPNVVFGGDMNWDDKLDGQPPLSQGWFDAWLKFQPNQPGLTYDSKANPMLGGGRLYKRLDRVFCNLRDFTVESIEMVGTQPIAGVTYQKERKVKGQVHVTTLPVLPSDHFGLLLKLKRIST